MEAGLLIVFLMAKLPDWSTNLQAEVLWSSDVVLGDAVVCHSLSFYVIESLLQSYKVSPAGHYSSVLATFPWKRLLGKFKTT